MPVSVARTFVVTTTVPLVKLDSIGNKIGIVAAAPATLENGNTTAWVVYWALLLARLDSAGN